MWNCSRLANNLEDFFQSLSFIQSLASLRARITRHSFRIDTAATILSLSILVLGTVGAGARQSAMMPQALDKKNPNYLLHCGWKRQARLSFLGSRTCTMGLAGLAAKRRKWFPIRGGDGIERAHSPLLGRAGQRRVRRNAADHGRGTAGSGCLHTS